jgi:hypothetical protein
MGLPIATNAAYEVVTIITTVTRRSGRMGAKICRPCGEICANGSEDLRAMRGDLLARL